MPGSRSEAASRMKDEMPEEPEDPEEVFDDGGTTEEAQAERDKMRIEVGQQDKQGSYNIAKMFGA